MSIHALLTCPVTIAVGGGLVGLAIGIVLGRVVEPARPKERGTVLAIVGVVIVILLMVAIVLFPPTIVSWDQGSTHLGIRDRLVATSAARQALLFAAGGLLAIVTLAFTFLRDQVARSSAERDRDANLTKRFSEAITQLGDPSSTIRLGAVYALERIAADSPRDRQPILDILTAFVRESSAPIMPPSSPLPSVSSLPSTSPVTPPSADVVAAADAIGRTTQLSEPSKPVNLAFTDLRDVDLRGANFRGATLHGANLIGTHLEGADFTGAWIHGAQFDGAFLKGAIFDKASLYASAFDHATLAGASLRGTRLEDVSLASTDFTGADIEGATNLDSARWDAGTKWPAGFTPPSAISTV